MVNMLVPTHFFYKDKPECFIRSDYLYRRIFAPNGTKSTHIIVFGRNRIALVLFVFTLRAMYLLHSLSSARDLFSLVGRIKSDESENSYLVSSAYIMNFIVVSILMRLLMYKLKSSWQRILPCGTPDN